MNDPTEPFKIGEVVRSAVDSDLPSVDLRTAKAYKVEDRQQRPMYPGGRVVWFYRLSGHKRCNVYHAFLRKTEGVVGVV